MRFNIKNWQDKYLIKESKLKEMDFKDQAAFDKYQSKHNMRKSTKVSIAGKDTTAGEAGGDKKTKGKPKTKKVEKHTSKKFKKLAIPVMNDMLDDAIENYDSDFDEWVEFGLNNPPANVDAGMEDLHNISNDEELEAFRQIAIDRVKEYLEDNK